MRCGEMSTNTASEERTGRKERNGESALKRLPPRRIAGLRKEHEILRLFMRFPLTFVHYAWRNSTEKVRDGVDDGDTDGTKTQGHNSTKQRPPRTNPGSMRRGEKGALDDVVCVHFRAYFLCFWQVSTAESVASLPGAWLHGELRGFASLKNTKDVGPPEQYPHQRKEHNESCKMVCLLTLYVLYALRTTMTQRRSAERDGGQSSRAGQRRGSPTPLNGGVYPPKPHQKEEQDETSKMLSFSSSCVLPTSRTRVINPRSRTFRGGSRGASPKLRAPQRKDRRLTDEKKSLKRKSARTNSTSSERA